MIAGETLAGHMRQMIAALEDERQALATLDLDLLAASVRTANAGGLQGGVSILETYLAENPRDVVAHRLAQFELFWSGESR